MNLHLEKWMQLRNQLPVYPVSSIGDFSLARRVMPLGDRAQCYDPYQGLLFVAPNPVEYTATRLLERHIVWMSDTQLEVMGNARILEGVRGDVLTAGLGMGIFAYLAALQPAVVSVTVVEKSQEVVDLVGPVIAHPKLKVLRGDVHETFKMHKGLYDFVYLDIWANLQSPTLEYAKYKRLARPCLKAGGETHIWLEELTKRVLPLLPRKPVANSGMTNSPCLVCSKTLRHDFAGLCMDCADLFGVSDLFQKRRS